MEREREERGGVRDASFLLGEKKEYKEGGYSHAKGFWDENDGKVVMLIDASLQPIDGHDVQQQKLLPS